MFNNRFVFVMFYAANIVNVFYVQHIFTEKCIFRQKKSAEAEETALCRLLKTLKLTFGRFPLLCVKTKRCKYK